MKMFHLLLGAALVFTTACAPDRNLEDWKKEKIAEELSKLQEVSGTYQGTLISKQDGVGELGSLSLELKAETKVGGRGSDYSNDKTPALRGTATLYRENHAMTVSFEDGAYDSDLKTFQVSPEPIHASGEKITINIQGVKAGNKLFGNMDIVGFSKFGGEFELIKDTTLPAPPTDPINSGSSKFPPPTSSQYYEATYLDQTGKEKIIGMLINPSYQRGSQLLIELLHAIRTVEITLFFDSTYTVRVSFPNASWDLRNGSIGANTEVMVSGMKARLTLDCKKGEESLDCIYSSSNPDSNGSKTLLFKPVRK